MTVGYEKIKTIFWCKKVFERLGVSDASQLKMNKKNEQLHEEISELFSEEHRDLAEELFLSGDTTIKWGEYCTGKRIVDLGVKKSSESIPSRVNKLFPGTLKYRTAGPCNLFMIMELDDYEEAVAIFEASMKEAFLAKNKKVLIDHNGNGVSLYTWWHIERVLDADFEPLYKRQRFEKLTSFIPMEFGINICPEIEDDYFLKLSAAYIKARFDNSEPSRNVFRSVTMLDLTEPDNQRLLYFNTQYGIPTELWFENKWFEKTRLEFISDCSEQFPAHVKNFIFK